MAEITPRLRTQLMDEKDQATNPNDTGSESLADIVVPKKITKPIIYTEEFVKKEVEGILDEILIDKEIVYIGELFEKRAYPRENFSRWAEQFKNNEEISHTIKRIKELLEMRINIGGLKNKLNPTMTIFNLKNNYNWKDKSEVDNYITYPKPILDVQQNESDNQGNGNESEG